MRTGIAVTTAPATAVCVGTLTDEHSASQSPLTARSGRRSIVMCRTKIPKKMDFVVLLAANRHVALLARLSLCAR